MFSEERQRKIREILLEYEHVDITTLTTLLDTSVTTVRRDLDKLESEGFLRKAHGGAVLVNTRTGQPIVVDDPFINEKRQIGELAAHFIEDNDTLFIGGGQTCLQIAKHIKTKHNLHVVTNSLNVANELAPVSEIKVFTTGGHVNMDKGNMTLEGPSTMQSLDTMFVQKAFFTVDGISIERGYTVYSTSGVDVIRKLVSVAQDVILVADQSKFGVTAFLPLFPMNRIGKVISNVQIPDVYKEYYYSNGVRIYMSFEDIN